MICKRCMTVMEAGTTYEQSRDGRSLTKRFRKCKKCGDKVYTREPNFQECMKKASEKCRNK